jgi:hypothetical protein
MRNIGSRSAGLVLIFLALILSRGPAFSQLPPPPPPIPVMVWDFWPLESAPWDSSYAQPAMGYTNVTVAPGWDYAGTALSVDTNAAVYVELEGFQDDWPNITFDSGSVSLWFQANWTSAGRCRNGANQLGHAAFRGQLDH